MTLDRSSTSTFTDALCALLIMALLVLGCGRFGPAPRGGAEAVAAQPVPVIDGTEPFPAMSADLLNGLAAQVPDLGRHRDNILEAERTAIAALLDGLKAKKRAAKGNRRPTPVSRTLALKDSHRTGPVASNDAPTGRFSVFPVVMASELSGIGSVQPFLIGHQIGAYSSDIASVGGSDVGQSKTVPMKDESTGEVQATMTLSVEPDGSVSTELSTNISMPQFGLDANSKVKISGNVCPSPDGKINISVEYASTGRAGTSGAASYDKTINSTITASVDDEAELAEINVDLKQSTRSNTGGRTVSVESSQTAGGATSEFSGVQFGGVKISAGSSQVTAADEDLSSEGLKNAYRLAHGALTAAREKWQGRSCVKIDAKSPGKVDTGSTTQVPVKVVHKLDGADVPSKLDIELSGGASIEPAVILRTSGTLSYTAPGEPGRTATIKLKATSKRGRAELELTATTGNKAFRVSAESNKVSFTGTICNIDKPFTLDAKFPGGTSVMTFNPGGAMSSSGSGSGCTQTGTGTFNIFTNADGSARLDWSSSDTVKCPMGFSNSRSNEFSVSLQPAPELACP